MGYLVILGIIIYIFYKIGQKSHFEKEETNTRKIFDNNSTKSTNFDPEAVRIREEVERIKKQAEKEGLDDLLKDFYEETKYYASWVKNDKNFKLPPFIEKADIEKVDKDENSKYTLLLRSGNKYTIVYKENTYGFVDDSTYVNIDLIKEKKVIFSISGVLQTTEWRSYINSLSVDIYNLKENEWIKEFRQILDYIKDEENRKNKESYEDQNALNKLKEDFGIE